MTTKTTIPADHVTWCQTMNGYADALCPDTHDHHDVAIDADGKILWRIDKVGTTYLMPDGTTYRLVLHDDEPFVDPPCVLPLIPRYDYWSPQGGASGHLRVGDGTIWDGDRLADGVQRVVLVEQQRPQVGSLYVLPNGESWRLTGWAPGWLREESHDTPHWSITKPNGMLSVLTEDALPQSARLVWEP